MNRDEWAALGRATITVTLGALPFAALGWWVSWWLVGGILAASAIAAGLWMELRWRTPRPW